MTTKNSRPLRPSAEQPERPADPGPEFRAKRAEHPKAQKDASSRNLLFCTRCGIPSDDAEFCPNCGMRRCATCS